MSRNESREMYLLTVYKLEQQKGAARSVDVARKLGVSKPSVTKAMGALVQQGLVTRERYGPVRLTEEGERQAKQVFDKHELIRKFIVSSLDMSPKQAEKDACRIEHVISRSMVSAIESYLS